MARHSNLDRIEAAPQILLPLLVQVAGSLSNIVRTSAVWGFTTGHTSTSLLPFYPGRQPGFIAKTGY